MKKIFILLVVFTVVLSADFSRDDTKEIVTDDCTTLQWQDNSDAKTITKEWDEAIDYCENLTLGGHEDWRLPNINELYTIVDRSKSDPAMDTAFQNVVSSGYWSSTTYAGNASDAWGVLFSHGVGYWSAKDYSYYVRCVRGGQ